MHLYVTADGHHTTARFAPRTSLTTDTAEGLGRALAALVEGREQPDLALDLGGVEFLGSTGLTTLLGLDRTVRSAGGRLTLTNVKPTVRRVFAVTRLDRVLDLRGTPGRTGKPRHW